MAEIVKGRTYLEIRDSDLRVRLIPITAEIIRCIVSRKPIREDAPSLLIEEKEYPEVPFSIREKEKSFCLRTEKLGAEFHLDQAEISWLHPDGKIWLQEGGWKLKPTEVFHYTTGEEEPRIRRVKTVDGERNFIQNLRPVFHRNAYEATLFFHFRDQEGIYGLGQGEDGISNYRGHTQYLYQHNMRTPMPLMVSSEGYGILFDCCSLMIFQDEGESSGMFLDTVEQLDYYFLGGGTMDRIVHDYRYLTGKAQMLPKWSFGYIQSKESYHTSGELLGIVRRYRSLSVPLDCVVQDWNTWEEGHWGEKRMDPSRYGDIKSCLEEIHRLHAHAMISVWPNMNAGTGDYQEFFDAGYLLNDLSTYDAFHEKAREMYWNQAERELFSDGFDAWWCDSTEPFSGPDWNGETKRDSKERYLLVGGEHKKYLDPSEANAYSLMHAKGIYENQRKARPGKRVLNLTRSGYASIQRYGAMLWSGDTCATWTNFRRQIIEGLNMGLSGYPYWTMDIGAFFTVKNNWRHRGCGCDTDPTPKWFWQGDYENGVEDPGYRELYTRWLQVGTFLPMFRSHGTDTPREIWNFGKKGTLFYDAIEKFILLRYHLMPYIYSVAAAVHFSDSTMMRSLLFDFPKDPGVQEVPTEFMFGPSLLICPVTEPMYFDKEGRPIRSDKTWRCYLPEGADWIDYWTHKKYEGGTAVTVEAPIDQMPVFVKAGTILPTVKGLQYAMDQPQEPMQIEVYPGEDARFLYYEDDGESYGFETGAFATTLFIWEEKEKVLRQEPRRGSYPGMKKLCYTIRVIDV